MAAQNRAGLGDPAGISYVQWGSLTMPRYSMESADQFYNNFILEVVPNIHNSQAWYQRNLSGLNDPNERIEEQVSWLSKVGFVGTADCLSLRMLIRHRRSTSWYSLPILFWCYCQP
jgi:hypothetical protein